MVANGYVQKQRLHKSRRIAFGLVTINLLTLITATQSSAVTLASFTTRYEANLSGDFGITGNTVVTCSEESGDFGSSSCVNARAGEGPLISLDNDAHKMRNLEVPLGLLESSKVFNSSVGELRVPPGSTIKYAELFWSGSLLVDSGDIPPVDAAAKNEVLFAVGNQDCTLPGDPCVVTANADQVAVESLGVDSGQYRASAVVTSELQAADFSTSDGVSKLNLAVGNVQTSLGVDKAAGWSVMVVYENSDSELRHVQILGGLGVVARRSGSVVGISGFHTPENGPVNSALGLVAFDGDLGDSTDSIFLTQGNSQTLLADAQNPNNNIANSTVSSSGRISSYLNNSSPARSVNTLGVDADRLDLVNALPYGATSATISMSAQQDTWYPTALAHSTELAAPELELEKYVSEFSGASSAQVAVGDSITYKIAATNIGTASATNVVFRDVLPPDFSLVASSGTDCPVVPPGSICKTFAEIEVGERVAVNIRGTINGASQFTSGDFVNQATTTYRGPIDSYEGISPEVTVAYGPLQVDLVADLEFAKTYIQAGESSNLVSRIFNFGPASATDPNVLFNSQNGPLKVDAMPQGCTRISTTKIRCSAAAYGISATSALEPGESAEVALRVTPLARAHSLRVLMEIESGHPAGDSNIENNSAIARVLINHPPIAKPLVIRAFVDGSPITKSLVQYVSDVDGDLLRVIVGDALHGQLKLVGSRIVYTPNSSWTGKQIIGYSISDGKGGRDTSTITVVVTKKNQGNIPTPQIPTHSRCFMSTPMGC